MLENRGKSGGALQPPHRNISCHSKRRNKVLFQLGDMRETDGNIKPLQGRLNNEHSVFCFEFYTVSAFILLQRLSKKPWIIALFMFLFI